MTPADSARALEAWAYARGWRGTDPYDALNATRIVAPLRRTRRGRQVLTQVVKRSPLDLRPLLGIPRDESAAALALAASAYARNGFLDDAIARKRRDECVARLVALRSAGFDEICWGYHFDVQTRVFFYPRNSPNAIATVFGGLALLDAGDVERAESVGNFFIRHVPQTVDPPGAYFGYLVGDRTPIHNANMLIAMLLTRLAHVTGREDFAGAAERAVTYTVARQRPDGAWPYGERPDLGWVDNHHTAYVLEALTVCRAPEDAIERGVAFYRERLLDPDGAPRYFDTSRLPVDGQAVAAAIQALSIMGDAEGASRVFQYAITQLRRPDGAFVFQRDRAWTIRTPHMRWVEAPMLLALTHLIELEAADPKRSGLHADAE